MGMRQITLLDLLNEYITLGYPSCQNIPYYNLDQELDGGDLTILRWGVSYCEVIYLTNGSLLLLQKELIKLCSGFYNSRGEEIVRLKETPGSSLWELIIVSENILNRKYVDPFKLKSTKDLRDWLETKHKIIIDPILYISRNETIII